MDHVEVAQAFAALSHPVRLRIVISLAERSNGVAAGVLASELGVRQNTLSSHVAKLERAGLVFGQRQGRYIIYRLNRFMAGSVLRHAAHWMGNPSPADLAAGN